MSLDDDERVRFYLRHRDQIEEWAALRTEAARAIDEWLLGLAPQVEALALELGAEVFSRLDEDEPYPAYRLARASWPMASAGPVASVSLEWIRGRTTMRPTLAPYVGLRCPKTEPLGVALREGETVRKIRAARKELTTTWWVGYGYVSPGPKFLEAADEYRDTLLAAVRASWGAYAHAVDLVQSKAPSVLPA